LETAEDELAEDGNDITPVQGNSTNIENTEDSGVTTKADKVDGNAEEYGHPDSVKRGAGTAVDFGPYVAEWNKTVSREGEHSATKCLCSSETNELKDNEGTYREDNTASLAKRVKIDLCNRLCERRYKDSIVRVTDVAHAEAEHNIE